MFLLNEDDLPPEARNVPIDSTYNRPTSNLTMVLRYGTDLYAAVGRKVLHMFAVIPKRWIVNIPFPGRKIAPAIGPVK